MKELLLLVGGAALVAVLADLCIWHFHEPRRRRNAVVSPGLLIVLFMLWLVAGFGLIDLRVSSLYEYPARIGFLSASFAALGFLSRRFDQPLFRYAGLALLPLLTAVLLWEYAPPLRSNAWPAWLAALFVHLYVLHPFAASNRAAQVWHVLGIALIVLGLVLQLHWYIGVTTWENAAISLALGVLSLACLGAHRWAIRQRPLYQRIAGVLAAGNLVFLTVVSLATDGDPMPLAYRPLLNPYDIAAVAALAVAALVIRSATHMRWRLWLGLAACTLVLLWLSAMRGVDYL